MKVVLLASYFALAIEAVVRGVHHEAEAWLAPQIPLSAIQCDFEASLPGRSSNLEIDVGLTQLECSINDDTSLGRSLHREERLTWLSRSKIASAGSNCISYTPSVTAGWNYQLCLGREITAHRGSKLTALPGSTLLSFGFHEPDQDEHFINGSLMQYYSGGMGQRSSRVAFVCSESLLQVSKAGISPDGLNASFEISAPQFCDWRRDADRRPPLDRLLAEDIGRCFNLTLNYWTYEYCHPDSLTQFHLEPNGSVVTPMFLMGGLRAMATPPNQAATDSGIVWPAASPSFPIIRSVFEPSKQVPATAVAKWRGSLVQRFRNLPMEVIAMPLWVVNLLNMPSTHRALGFYLGKGSPCPEIPGGLRSTRVIFVCPPWMQLGSGTRLVAIRETRTCEYELVVEAVGICAHPALRPAVPEIPNVITCDRRRQAKPSSTRLDNLAFSPRAINLVARFVNEEITMEQFAEALWVPETAAVNALRRPG